MKQAQVHPSEQRVVETPMGVSFKLGVLKVLLTIVGLSSYFVEATIIIIIHYDVT